MENDQEKLKQHLIQLRRELMRAKQDLVNVKQLLRDRNSTIKEFIKGFKVISETRNARVADVFLDGLDENCEN